MIRASLNFLVCFVLIIFPSISLAFTLESITNFNDWNEVESKEQFQITDSIVEVSTDSEANFFHRHADTTIGLVTTINISSITPNAAAGIGMYLGYLGTDKVHCNLTVYQSGSNQQIYYHIRLKNESDELYESLAWGRFGDTDEPILDRDITVGFMRVDNEIWFYAEGYHIIRWSPFAKMGAGKSDMWLWAWADQETEGDITATFSNLFTIQQ